MMEENIYWRMFQNCPSLPKCPQFGEEKQKEIKRQTEDIQFDGFDWDTDMREAFNK